jgi:hypothetical protein
MRVCVQRYVPAAFADNAMGRTQVFEWFYRFKSGETSVEYCEFSGHLSTRRTEENIKKDGKIINEGR